MRWKKRTKTHGKLTIWATKMFNPWTEIWKFPATLWTSKTPKTCKLNKNPRFLKYKFKRSWTSSLKKEWTT